MVIRKAWSSCPEGWHYEGPMRFHVSPDAEAAAVAAAAFIARRVWPAVHRRGRFSLAVSGGSTPAPMFAALAARSLPWGAVHVYQVDERVAPKGSPERNSSQLGVLPVPVGNLHLIEVDWEERLAVASYAAALPAPLDVVHLGLGDDGHTASWPPGDPVVDAGVPVTAVGPFHGRRRITLTPPPVNAARTRLVLVCGEAKAPMVGRWAEGDRTLPIARVRRADCDVFLDEAAAAGLPPALHPR